MYQTIEAFDQGLIQRCLNCGLVSVATPEYSHVDLYPGGWMYEMIRRKFSFLELASHRFLFDAEYFTLLHHRPGPYEFTRIPNKHFAYNPDLDCLELTKDEEAFDPAVCC